MLRSAMSSFDTEKRVYRVVLTGGPCSGKTTGQARLSTFFENLGWKVYRVPETATLLFSGGIRFAELRDEEVDKFQENLIKTMMTTENTFFNLAESCSRNCLVICDRGVMDAAAYMSKEAYNKVMGNNNWNTVDVRDNRYNQVIHLITAANGAEEFYNIAMANKDNPFRTEGLELAREKDRLAAEAWVGHPYIDCIDNSTDFDTKLRTMIANVCHRLDIDTGDRLAVNSQKFKFLVGSLPPDEVFPPFQDFDVIHDYLVTGYPFIQSRLRKRGQNGTWSYQATTRRVETGRQTVEVRRQLSPRDYQNMLAQRDLSRNRIYKTRRCFLWENMYFQMDIYKLPCHPRCNGLILLETYSTLTGEELRTRLPPFLDIKKEVKGDPSYSMFNLSLKADWTAGKLGSNCNEIGANHVHGLANKTQIN